jgi:hypothetical protein
MRETRDVENNISRMAILPSFVSKHLENGSVVKMRKPRVVPVAAVRLHFARTFGSE